MVLYSHESNTQSSSIYKRKTRSRDLILSKVIFAVQSINCVMQIGQDAQILENL